MTAKLKVINRTLFNQKVLSVDFKDLVPEGVGFFDGGVCIKATDDRVYPHYGLIQESDFEGEFGFLIIAE